MNNTTLFIKLAKKEFPDLKFGMGVGTSPPTVAVFNTDDEVQKYCRQIRSFLGGKGVIRVIFLPKHTYNEPKPKKTSFLDKIVDNFLYFNVFMWLKRKNPQK